MISGVTQGNLGVLFCSGWLKLIGYLRNKALK